MTNEDARRAALEHARLAILECWYRAGVYGYPYGTLDDIDHALDHIAETGEFPPWLREDQRPPDSERLEKRGEP